MAELNVGDWVRVNYLDLEFYGQISKRSQLDSKPTSFVIWVDSDGKQREGEYWNYQLEAVDEEQVKGSPLYERNKKLKDTLEDWLCQP